MSTLREISEALEERLDTVQGLRVADHPEPGLTPPFSWPRFVGWTPDTMGRSGYVVASFDIYVFTSGTVRTIDGYRALMSYADWSGSSSIWLALWDGNDLAAGTFAGLTDTTVDVDTVGGFRSLGLDDVDAYQLNGGVFSVNVRTKG